MLLFFHDCGNGIIVIKNILYQGVFNKIPLNFEKSIFNENDKYDISEYDIVVPVFWLDRELSSKSTKKFISELKKIFLDIKY